MGDGYQAGGREEDEGEWSETWPDGSEKEESNGTQPDGEQQVIGGDGVHRGQG